MTYKELQKAFIDEVPVMYDGAVYLKIEKIIFAKKDGHIIETAQLLDKCGNSSVTVHAKFVEKCTEIM